MYPYNIDSAANHHNASTVMMNTRENTAHKKAQLAKDQQFLSMMETALAEAVDTEKRYNGLCQKVREKNIQQSLHTAELDQKKHQMQLQDIAYQITGNQMAMPEEKSEQSESTASPQTNSLEIEVELENLLNDEMENADFYRELLSNMPEGELWDEMFEMFTDKQDHCTRLVYICCQYQES